MKIVVTGTRGIPNIQGGVETHCQELYPCISKRGHDVTIIRRKSYITKQNKIESYKGVSLLDIYAPKIKSIEAITHTFFSIIRAYRLKPDILHIHAIGPSILVPLAKLLGMKVVVTHHGFDYERHKWGKIAKTMLRLGESFAIKYADKIIAVSDYIENNLREKYGRKDINVIYNGVGIPVITDKKNDLLYKLGLNGNDYIFAMGRFVEEKGFHDLIEVYRDLPQELKSQYKLVLAGEADFNDKYSANLKRMANDTQGVILPGFVSGRLKNQLFSNARLFIIPSYHEGLPIILLEALSYGLDVIVSDIEANKIAPLTNSNVFFSAGDKVELSSLIKDALKCSKFNVSVRKKYDLELYDWNRIAKMTEVVYKTIY